MEKIKKMKKWFIEVKNSVKWFIKEIGKIYSTEDSYFSKKRIESGMAFAIGQFGMVYFLIQNVYTMTMQDMLMWSGTEFLMAGYTVSQIQKEKKRKDVEPGTESGPKILND
jgi:hypothetical protein|tara:strand:+ start:107 stop:439 length:333 start_codon:yes stop_codon:yes gene_type:complete